ncbi:MAG TPA: hypothetical protein DEA78_18310 [Cyanobacteria bacterium UBA11159]|nr:hypothetical protein [Cyanobacteria bacterium UBA11367]HBE56194.1 hypothetical protein [Cyanobacteria bacterium UBA11366]HBK65988.1 hypothetical protein [Cyanobacteria bacterium UBA11166]HBR75601.1 hypothetical protein [Cyanobacteria bacterium UBA11159]HBS68480.1 hypothetical protein [Cyanobacteria bacterium UBA11153]HCA95420.1 hypothetical protein [Cyanobacteria bacterium UBA9226]
MAVTRKALCGFLVFCTLTLSGCVQTTSKLQPSGEWIPVGETQEKDIISIDTGKYKKENQTASVWVRVDYRNPPQPTLNAIQFYGKFDCDRETYQIQRKIQLGLEGETLQDEIIEMESKSAPSDSTEGVVLERVCFEDKTENTKGL